MFKLRCSLLDFYLGEMSVRNPRIHLEKQGTVVRRELEVRAMVVRPHLFNALKALGSDNITFQGH